MFVSGGGFVSREGFVLLEKTVGAVCSLFSGVCIQHLVGPLDPGEYVAELLVLSPQTADDNAANAVHEVRKIFSLCSFRRRSSLALSVSGFSDSMGEHCRTVRTCLQGYHTRGRRDESGNQESALLYVSVSPYLPPCRALPICLPLSVLSSFSSYLCVSHCCW